MKLKWNTLTDAEVLILLEGVYLTLIWMCQMMSWTLSVIEMNMQSPQAPWFQDWTQK